MERMGQLGAVGLALESSWGVPVAATRYVEARRADIARLVSYEIPETIRGTRARRQVRAGANSYAGLLDFDVSAGNIGEVLKAAFGTVTTTLVTSTASGAVFEHTFRRTDATALPSLTVEQNMGGLTSRLIAGVRVNRLTLSLGPGRALLAEADCRGQSETLIAPTAPSYALDEALHHSGFMAQVDGEDSREMEAFEVSFGNNLVDDIVTAGGAADIARLPAGTFAASGRMLLGFEATTAYQTFATAETAALRVSLVGATIVATWRSLLQIDLPRVRYTAVDLPLTPGRLSYEIAFEALLDPAQSPPTEAVLTLRNGVAEY